MHRRQHEQGNADDAHRRALCDKNFVYRRETGLIEELLLENLHNNPQNSVELWDMNLQTAVYHEKNLELFLHLAIDSVRMAEAGKESPKCPATARKASSISFRAPFCRLYRKRHRGLPDRGSLFCGERTQRGF